MLVIKIGLLIHKFYNIILTVFLHKRLKMMFPKWSLCLPGLILLVGTSQTVMAQETIAKLLIDKSLEKINVEARKNVTTDLASVTEKYADKVAYDNKKVKSRKTNTRIITGRPKLGYLNIDDLYGAFATRFDFLIDNNNSTAIIDGTQYGLIRFVPKPNLVSKTVTDAIINHTSGKVYIDIDNNVIVRIEGGVSDHFLTTWRAWYSPISFDIDIYEFSFSINYTVFNNVVIEKNLEGMVDYEIRNRGIERHVYTLSNYRMQR